jgi:flagellar basal body-associated protein FliL
MPEPRRSKRFNPNAVTEKIVPILLVILLLILLGVLMIIVLSLIPSV